MVINSHETQGNMTEGVSERVAEMNPDAVEQAKVFHGRIHYFNGRDIDLPNMTLVEVGKWAREGFEVSEDHLCTYYAALLLGFEPEWLPYGETRHYKFFIGNGRNEKDEVISFSEEQAIRITAAINNVYSSAYFSRLDLKIAGIL